MKKDTADIQDIAKANAVMAMDQLPEGLTPCEQYHFFMDYYDNTKDTVLEKGGNYNAACKACDMFMAVLSDNGWVEDEGGPCEMTKR